MTAPLLILDTPALYYRAFYALPDTIRAPDGTPVNAVRGVLDTISQLTEMFASSRVIATMDADWRPAFRTAIVPEYKAQRITDHEAGTETPEDLAVQLPLLRTCLQAAGIPVAEVPGTEADDVIASLVAGSRAAAGAGADAPAAVIVSPDRDLLALLDDAGSVRIARPLKGGKWEQLVAADLPARYGVADGAAYRAMAALRGDPSDGLPGVPGIGEKTAAKLISGYGSLDGVLEAAQAGENDHGLSPKRREAICAHADAVQRAHTVMTCREDLDVSGFLTAADAAEQQRDAAALTQLAADNGLERSAARLLAALGTGAEPAQGALFAEPDDAEAQALAEARAIAEAEAQADAATVVPTAQADAAAAAPAPPAAIPAAPARPAAPLAAPTSRTGPGAAQVTDASGTVGEATTLFDAPAALPGGWTRLPLYGFDLETTGTDPHTARIVTASLCAFRDGVEESRLEWLVDPEIEIPAAAAAVHGISTAHARAHGRPRNEAIGELLDWFARIRAEGGVIIGHNIVYDLTILQAEAHRIGRPGAAAAVCPPVIDTFVLDKQVDPYRRGSRVLSALAGHWGVALENAHDASADAIAAVQISLAIAAAHPEAIGSLSAADLHARQVEWKRAQNADFEAYLRRRKGDPSITLSRDWPFEAHQDRA